jgi:hypothetical protein
MNGTPTEWTLKGFCSHFGFVHYKMPDHAFAWVLGAGASKPSGIPTGSELVTRWLKERDPQHATNTVNFGEFLVTYGRMDEAVPLLQGAWTLNQGKPNQLSSEVAFFIGIIARYAGRDDAQALGRLKTLLLAGFQREPWSFDAILEFAQAKLSVEDQAFYSALAEAILDADRVTTLDTFERWRSVASIPLDQQWEIKVD